MLIRGCLTSARSSIRLNGNPFDELWLWRGLRQVDPLSPFLFILVTEGLQVSLEDSTHNLMFKGVSIGNQNIHISHLFFADDVIFLGEWYVENIRRLIRIIILFYMVFGLQINVQKS